MLMRPILRHRRAGGAGRLAKILLLFLVVPILLGVGVALVAGRPLAFAVVQRMTISADGLLRIYKGDSGEESTYADNPG